MLLIFLLRKRFASMGSCDPQFLIAIRSFQPFLEGVIFVARNSTQLYEGVIWVPRIAFSEVVNRCLENYLRCFGSEQLKQWAHWLPWAKYWYNTIYHISINMTPFSIVYSRTPPSLFSYGNRKNANNMLEQQLLDGDRSSRNIWLKRNLEPSNLLIDIKEK